MAPNAAAPAATRSGRSAGPRGRRNDQKRHNQKDARDLDDGSDDRHHQQPEDGPRALRLAEAANACDGLRCVTIDHSPVHPSRAGNGRHESRPAGSNSCWRILAHYQNVSAAVTRHSTFATTAAGRGLTALWRLVQGPVAARDGRVLPRVRELRLPVVGNSPRFLGDPIHSCVEFDGDPFRSRQKTRVISTGRDDRHHRQDPEQAHPNPLRAVESDRERRLGNHDQCERTPHAACQGSS